MRKPRRELVTKTGGAVDCAGRVKLVTLAYCQPDREPREASMSIAVRLGVMMFLEYVIWGSWLPLLSRYLTDFRGFTGTQVAFVMGTAAIASLTAAFVSAQLADRYFSTERILACRPRHPADAASRAAAA
jgi:nucleoside H+ symporter